MQVEEITQILRESPSVRLIKSRSVDFFLSFVIEAFEGQAAINAGTLAHATGEPTG